MFYFAVLTVGLLCGPLYGAAKSVAPRPSVCLSVRLSVSQYRASDLLEIGKL